MPTARHRREWEDLASVDPYWAILSDPGKRFDGWEAGEFLDTGHGSIERVMHRARKLGRPERFESALDFGCGVGRLTRQLAKHFGEVVGTDVSERMVAEARRVSEAGNCRFVVNPEDGLAIFGDGSFDLVHSWLVLQHLPGQGVISSFILELWRVLRPGGLLVFELPSRIAPAHRLQPQRRAYSALRALGAPPRALHRLRLSPVRMHSMPVAAVTGLLDGAGATLLDVRTKRAASDGRVSSTYYVSR